MNISWTKIVHFSPCCSNSATASNHKHAILSFLIAALLALLPLKFHPMNTSAAVFDTHRAILSKFLITTLVYAVVLAIEINLGTNNSPYHLIVSKISLLLGSLGAACLLLILVRGLGYVTLLIWALFLVKLIYEACQSLHQLYRAISFASDLFNGLGRSRGGYQNERRIMLPV